MPGRGSVLLVLFTCITGSALAQPGTEPSPLQLGIAAMDAHDPTAAIAQFERANSKAGRAWLAVALMMESRSPSDRYVERAFEVAARARADQAQQLRSRAELAAALQPGDMLVTFLVGERHAYAWAFNRDALVGYPLPPPAAIATAVERINAYLARRDLAGVQRIADDLTPALLGPVLDQIPALRRLIFVMDGPLRQLPIGDLRTGDGTSALAERVALSIVDDESLFDEIARPPAPAQPQPPAWPMATLVTGAIVLAIVLVGVVAALRRRSSVA